MKNINKQNNKISFEENCNILLNFYTEKFSEIKKNLDPTILNPTIFDDNLLNKKFLKKGLLEGFLENNDKSGMTDAIKKNLPYYIIKKRKENSEQIPENLINCIRNYFLLKKLK